MASGDMLSPQGDASPWISDEVSCCGETGQPVNMETTSNPAAVAELPMVQSSEGEVSVFRIIEYLQSVTGQSCEEGRLQLLYKMLDPEERGVAVDLPTFHAVMKNWIADCRQDGGLDSTKERDKFVDNMCLWPSGKLRRPVSSSAQLEGYGGDVSSVNSEEAAALMSSIEDLEYGNKKLAVQNAKLQRTIEAAEELNSRLTEELSQLQGRLRSTQQALEQAKSVANELEDLKAIAKSLEEEKGKLCSQARQLEKEQLCLSLQVDCLQEENRKLLTESDRVKQKVAGLVAEKADLKAQLCEYETLLSCKDTALTEKTNRAEELTAMLAEYRTVVQELRLETSRLQEQLCHTTEDLAMLPKELPHELKPHVQLPAQPLCVEIEEIQQGQKAEASLPSPLCGMWPGSGAPASAQLLVGMSPVDVRAVAEEQDVGTADCTPAWLAQPSPTGEANPLAEQQQRLTPEMPESTEERRDWSCPAKEELCAHGAEEQLKLARGTSEEHSCLSCVETHVLPWPEGKAAKPICLEAGPADTLLSSAAERSPVGGLQQGALVPVQNQLSPIKQKQLDDCWFETLAPWFRLGLIFLLHRPQPHLLPSRLLLALLMTLLLLPALCYLVLPCRQQPSWTMPTGLAWPHLQLRYLRPPPV
ncbi:ABC transporter ATP-binding protein [Platysternon megacephalum]|uniref:ABC transporter ATP-binding protein n=1 Tax=Platysternon megacephalum TaxID=55544 RepID=A0A4D9DKG5_9SAUR|nr:ABC transporter ATP-binding protein [Platysternon megacephalum]